jgi:hypothetical protein
MPDRLRAPRCELECHSLSACLLNALLCLPACLSAHRFLSQLRPLLRLRPRRRLPPPRMPPPMPRSPLLQPTAAKRQQRPQQRWQRRLALRQQRRLPQARRHTVPPRLLRTSSGRHAANQSAKEQLRSFLKRLHSEQPTGPCPSRATSKTCPADRQRLLAPLCGPPLATPHSTPAQH